MEHVVYVILFHMQTHQLGDKVMFYLQESAAAQQLNKLKSLPSKDGPLTVFVKPSTAPKGIHDDGGGRRGGGRGGRGGGQRRGAGPYQSDVGGISNSGDAIMQESHLDVIQVNM